MKNFKCFSQSLSQKSHVSQISPSAKNSPVVPVPLGSMLSNLFIFLVLFFQTDKWNK